MAAAMSKSGLAISASGSTVWELCCLGVPSVVWPLAENQRGIAAALDRAGAAVAVDGIGEALAAARELISFPEKQLALCKAAWGLVDGRGAARVVDEMERRMGDQWGAKVPLPGTDSVSGAGEVRS
jgi:spore coat polysaccharide biosynthesis predicted glycosyltransferase SpsG